MAKIITVKTTRGECDVVRFGCGKKPFVLIPGMSMRPVSLSAPAIESAYRAFSDSYTVYVIDRIKIIPDGYTVEEMARDAAETMSALGIEHAYIAGMSQGGMIAEVLAAEYPTLAGRLVLGSTLARANEVSSETFETWSRLGESGEVRRLNEDVYSRIYEPEFISANREAFDLLIDDGTAEDAHRFAVLARACARFDYYDDLGRIKCPTLVIGSKNDNVLSGDGSVVIAEKLGCELYMYDGYGHAAYDTAPDYKKIILNFFEK